VNSNKAAKPFFDPFGGDLTKIKYCVIAERGKNTIGITGNFMDGKLPLCGNNKNLRKEVRQKWQKLTLFQDF